MALGTAPTGGRASYVAAKRQVKGLQFRRTAKSGVRQEPLPARGEGLAGTARRRDTKGPSREYFKKLLSTGLKNTRGLIVSRHCLLLGKAERLLANPTTRRCVCLLLSAERGPSRYRHSNPPPTRPASVPQPLYQVSCGVGIPEDQAPARIRRSRTRVSPPYAAEHPPSSTAVLLLVNGGLRC